MKPLYICDLNGNSNSVFELVTKNLSLLWNAGKYETLLDFLETQSKFISERAQRTILHSLALLPDLLGVLYPITKTRLLLGRKLSCLMLQKLVKP